MITLKTDATLVDIANWDEILNRVAFRQKLNPTIDPLKAIFGRYVEKDEIHCGLTTCNRPHKKGYLVKSESGLETNIGKDCGKTHFDIDFDDLARAFERDVTESRNRELLWSTLFRVEEIEASLAEIRNEPFGAVWVRRQLNAISTPNSGWPDVVLHALKRVLKSGTNLVSVEREANEAEIKSLEMSQGRTFPKPHYVEEPIGELDGLAAFSPENDLRVLLVFEIEEKLKTFAGLSIDELSFNELRDWAKWARAIDSNFEHARRSIALGRRLLTKKNLAVLEQFAEKKVDRELFQQFLSSLSKP